MSILEKAAHLIECELGTHCENCEQQLPYDPRELAKAVLRAIREPSEAMLRAERDFESEKGGMIFWPGNLWRAMIDAALEGKWDENHKAHRKTY